MRRAGTGRLAGSALLLALGSAGCGTADQQAPTLEIAEAAQPVTWSGHLFGIHATKSYEDGWQGRHVSQWNQSDNFRWHLDDSATQLFYYDLAGKESYWRAHEVPYNGIYGRDDWSNSLESVDLFFTHTHGGVDEWNARFTMWDDETRVYSRYMRLGDDNRRLSVFASVACHTLQWDAHTVFRWEPAFMGTLRMALGSHDFITCSLHDYGIAEKFADRMHQNWSIKASWHSGLSSSSSDNDSAVLVTGKNGDDWFDRLDHITWYNLDSWDRLGDSAADADGIINAWCISRVTNG